MIKTDKAHLLIGAGSHPGVTGKQNEDRYGVATSLVDEKNRTPSVAAVLCDGIGGHRAGEVAAEIGVSVITETISASDARQPLETLQQAITHANQAVYEASQQDSGRAGMGTTCAVAWVIGGRLYTANLGDSRIYLLRNNHLVQLTTDHTWVQEALDAGVISDVEGLSHPNAHVIRRYLGAATPPEVDFRLWFFEDEQDQDAINNQGLRLKPGDTLMLCSDGLTDLVTDEAISAIIQRTSLNESPQVLIDMANSRGGHDNITVLLMQVPLKKGRKAAKLNKRRWGLGCLIALMFVSLLIVIGMATLRLREDGLNRTTTSQPTAMGVLSTVTFKPTSTLEPLTATPTLAQEVEATAITTGQRATITPWPTDTVSP